MMGYRQQRPKIGLTVCPDLVDHYNHYISRFKQPMAGKTNLRHCNGQVGNMMAINKLNDLGVSVRKPQA